MAGSVTKWLDEIGLGQYSEAFEENAIDWKLLPGLDHDLLKELGVTVIGHRHTALDYLAPEAFQRAHPIRETVTAPRQQARNSDKPRSNQTMSKHADNSNERQLDRRSVLKMGAAGVAAAGAVGAGLVNTANASENPYAPPENPALPPSDMVLDPARAALESASR